MTMAESVRKKYNQLFEVRLLHHYWLDDDRLGSGRRVCRAIVICTGQQAVAVMGRA